MSYSAKVLPNKMKTINELFFEIGKTDKHTTHSYGYFYGPFLEHRRTTAKNVLEIGVTDFGGGSLEAFGLFFENANVYGIDTIPCEREWPENVSFILGNAYDTNVLEQFDGIQWDVVLDDGPHSWESQLSTLNYFYDKLAPGGVIMIEDIDGRKGHENFTNIFSGFKGGSNRLSVVDRTYCPQHNFNEFVILYM